MTKTEISLSTAQVAKLGVASAAYGLTSTEFICSAIDAALETCAEQDNRLGLVFGHIDRSEQQHELESA